MHDPNNNTNPAEIYVLTENELNGELTLFCINNNPTYVVDSI